MVVSRIEPQPRDSFLWTPEPWGPALRCAPLAEVADHLFTTRGLFLDRAGKGDGWRRLARAMDVADGALVRLVQIHGAGIVVVRRSDGGPAEQDGRVADIALSERPDAAIAVQVADCVPLLLADMRTGVVAAVHAGWRGAAARAPMVAVEALAREFGSQPGELIAAIGPSIGPCCYEVGEEVREAFRAAGHEAAAIGRWFSPDGAGGRPHLDLWRTTRDHLVSAGVLPGRIHTCGLCTATHRDVFYSFRGDGPGTGRMVGTIKARPASGRREEDRP